MLRKILYFTIGWIFLISCQTEIDVTPPGYYDKLVVDGFIEIGKPATVSLYKSIPYFSTMDLNTLLNEVMISDATVTLSSDKGEFEELFFTPDPNASLYVSYKGRKIIGQENTTYTLNIDYDKKKYSATSSILTPFSLDSIWFAPAFGRTEIDSTANIRILLTDPGLAPTYYQFLVKISNSSYTDRTWITTMPTAVDNSLFYGESIQYDILRGAPSLLFMPELNDNEMRNYLRGYYMAGDTVSIQYSIIDQNAYKFWSSADSEITYGQNPFMNPSPILSNVTSSSGEACLGSFTARASKEIRMVFPDK